MEPKKKSEQLIDKFCEIKTIVRSEAKQCALITVDEIIKELEMLKEQYEFDAGHFLNCWVTPAEVCTKGTVGYWNDVKTEIEKL